MINVAICDDDIQIVSDIEKMLINITTAKHINASFFTFSDGSTLIKSIQQGTYYDIIYIDIEMHQVDGISAAEAIRNMNIPTLIIFVSSHEKYWKTLYSVEPFEFITKPINTSHFNAVFDNAVKRVLQKPEFFTFMYDKRIIKIPLHEVCYFENTLRVIILHVSENCRSDYENPDEPRNRFYGKINEIEKKLSKSNSRFIRIHQSYLVNFDYIQSIKYGYITMKGGEKLYISEERKKEVRSLFCALSGYEVLPDD